MPEKISMDISETLELDYLVEQVSDNTIDITSEPSSGTMSVDYINTKTGVLNPSTTGTYKLDINGQTIEIEVMDIPDSGVSHWNFEQSLTDVWNNSTVFDGTGVGSIQYSTDSRVGSYSLQLNGTDTYVSLGNNIGLNTAGPFSVAGWVKMNETPDRATVLSGFSSDTRGTAFDVELSAFTGSPSTDNEFGVHTWNGYVTSEPDTVAPVGTWEHYCATYSGGELDGSNITLYVGGSEVPKTRVDSNNNNLSNNADDFEIGFSSKNSSNINLHDMNIDSLKTFSKELSSTEVSDLYNAGSINS